MQLWAAKAKKTEIVHKRVFLAFGGYFLKFGVSRRGFDFFFEIRRYFAALEHGFQFFNLGNRGRFLNRELYSFSLAIRHNCVSLICGLSGDKFRGVFTFRFPIYSLCFLPLQLPDALKVQYSQFWTFAYDKLP